MIEWFSFVLVNMLGAISPGSDFAIVTYYGLQGARRAALLATLGIAAALLVHVLYCIFGVVWFLQNSPRLFFGIQLIGASYLGYLGIRMWWDPPGSGASHSNEHASRRAFATGFFTNLLNPKAALFLLSLFSQFITPTTSVGMKVAFGVSVPLIAMSWFSLVACLITHRSFLPHLQNHQRLFTRVMGALLVCLALSVVWVACTGSSPLG